MHSDGYSSHRKLTTLRLEVQVPPFGGVEAFLGRTARMSFAHASKNDVGSPTT